jgi:hypothetical protein
MFRLHVILVALGLAGAITDGALAASADERALLDLDGDVRARVEHADADGAADAATALTVRTRLGVTTRRWHGLGARIEGEVVGVAVDDYALTSGEGRPVIADPDTAELNQLYVDWQGDGTLLRAGRQVISFGDQLYVGAADFRQNQQSFDAVRVSSDLGCVSIDYAYLARQRGALGDAAPGGDRRLDGHIGRAVIPAAPFGTWTLTAQHLDYDEPSAPSGTTVGIGVDDTLMLGEMRDISLVYRVDWARQWPDVGDVEVDYVRVSGEVGRPTLGFRAGAEWLGAEDGRAFGFPLGAAHPFQGLGDLFATTPAAGLRDIRAGIQTLRGQMFIAADMHWFADADGTRLGHEIDLMAMLPIDRNWSVEAAIAGFDGAADGPPDQLRAWVSVGYAFD